MKTQLSKHNATLLGIVCLFIITACGCTKTTEEERWNPELPPITQTGANTFGCKINGVIMIPRDSRVYSLGGIPTGVTYSVLRKPQNTANFDFIEASDRFTSRGGGGF